MTKQKFFKLNLQGKSAEPKQKRVMVPSAVQLEHEARVTIAKEIQKRTDKKTPHIDELIETILSYNSRVVRLINNHKFDDYPVVRKLLREELRDKFGIAANFDWTEQEWEQRIKTVPKKEK